METQHYYHDRKTAAAAAARRKARRRRAIRNRIIFGTVVALLLFGLVFGGIKLVKKLTKENQQNTEFTSAEDPAADSSTEESTAAAPSGPVDTTAPVITLKAALEAEVGGTISYKQAVEVTDDMDPAPSLSVDSSLVDLETAGTYNVIYTATDASGNSASLTCPVTVKAAETQAPEEGEAEMRQLARDILDSFLNPGMTELEKINAIYWWVKEDMVFVGTSNKDSWVSEADRGIREGTGDCFTFYAMTRALLDEAGIENLPVERLGGESHHYWNLVKYNGQWYHLDSCPRSEEHYGKWYCFLRTDAELAWFGENCVDYYYVFDHSLYPASATEALNLGSMQEKTE